MRWTAWSAALLLAGCGDDTTTPSPADAVDGGVTETGPPWGPGCAPGALALSDGRCEPAGVPADLCADGFETDGDFGCHALVPDDACPSGTMAVPGESRCHGVGSCDMVRWQSLVEGGAIVVDDDFAGPDPDGSTAKPWPSIAQAVAAASPGDVIAIAPGSYAGDLVVDFSGLTIAGACADSVTITGTTTWTVFLGPDAHDAVLSGVSITGPGAGVGVSGSKGVVVDGVRVFDAGDWGFDIEDSYGQTDAMIASSLVEDTTGIGVFVTGARARVSIVDTVVRDVEAAGPDAVGPGVIVQANAEVEVDGAVVERTTYVGLWAIGAKLAARRTLVRDTVASEGEGQGVLAATADITGTRADLLLDNVIVSRVDGSGVVVSGSNAVLQAVVVRDAAHRDATEAWGISAEARTSGGPTELVVRHALVEGTRGLGVATFGSHAVFEGVRVRDVVPGLEVPQGRGAVAQIFYGQPGLLELRGSVVERSAEIGVFGAGADIVLDTTVVSDVAPTSDGAFGMGVHVQEHDAFASILTMDRCLVHDVRDTGVMVSQSTASVNASWVRDVRPTAAGTFGDGVSVVAQQPSKATLGGTRIEGAARAGVANFGGYVELSGLTLECNGIHLDGEVNFGLPAVFDDLGDNACGCAGAAVACVVLSSDLTPPQVAEP